MERKSVEQTNVESNTTEDPINFKIFKRPKISFVWDYFRPLENSGGGSVKCIICDSKVSKRTSNLARRLLAAHDITRNNIKEKENEDFAANGNVGRTSRSFIWIYCTKVDCRFSRCHLCDKLLYSGSGNTGNISKHLQRKHSETIEIHGLTDSKDMEEADELIAIIAANEMESNAASTCGEEEVTQQANAITIVKTEAQQQNENLSGSAEVRKDRRASSYVWNYCIKLSRNEIRCKLCRKVMSFHGTANVITHLQRKHNIIGGVAHDNTAAFEVNEEKMALKNEDRPTAFRYRSQRSSANKSVVWTYYTRLSRDVVRCNICQKNLSFQGTSNCQRHLHRMHGIATQSRSFSGSKRETVDNATLIREYCEHIDGKQIKCTMCKSTFKENQTGAIRTHLKVSHSILTNVPASRRKRRRRNIEETSEDSDNCDYNNEDDNGEEENTQYKMDYSATDIKKDMPAFDDIIEEEDIAEETYCDEDPFDPTRMHDYPVAKLISATSSRDGSPEPTFKPSMDNSRLRLLNEERMRMETQYFREKAAYYRMQKYHTALQARKAKIELQRLQSSNLNGTSYNANVEFSDASTTQAGNGLFG